MLEVARKHNSLFRRQTLIATIQTSEACYLPNLRSTSPSSKLASPRGARCSRSKTRHPTRPSECSRRWPYRTAFRRASRQMEPSRRTLSPWRAYCQGQTTKPVVSSRQGHGTDEVGDAATRRRLENTMLQTREALHLAKVDKSALAFVKLQTSQQRRGKQT